MRPTPQMGNVSTGLDEQNIGQSGAELRGCSSHLPQNRPREVQPKVNHPDFRRKIDDQGYVLFSEFESAASTLEVASSLGVPLTPWEGGLVQTLKPQAKAAPNTYSGNFGFGRFPFHTDLAHWRVPPRYLLLRCQIGYLDVPTLMIDGRVLVNSVSKDILARAIFKPRRPRNGTYDLLRLYEVDIEGVDRLRWDELFLKPASRIGDTADGLIREWLRAAEYRGIALVRPGDTLVIDNWRMLHARAPISPDREDRSIQRVYLEAIH
ncbi:TauD/TfdA family dioxygenase [Paracoccus aerodenitrificans]|uniref:TauD/TfdA family dioxygenase n=1 Tax=Paracoccus aerodenitrificans TaxID=3017781 RepID=UPI0022F0DE7F|nr:TauD/TfdA family dioxygenase [Paracoccus aerodenitrificans]